MRLNFTVMTIIAFTSALIWSQEEKTTVLTVEEEKTASTLVAGLSDEDFDKRNQAQAQLINLVLSNESKSSAWDSWITRVRTQTTDLEIISRLPSNIAFRFKLCGRYKAIVTKGEVENEIEFLLDGTYKIFTGKSNRQQGQGKYTVRDRELVVLRGTITPFSNTGDEEFQCSAQLVEKKLITKIKFYDADVECTWVRLENIKKEVDATVRPTQK